MLVAESAPRQLQSEKSVILDSSTENCNGDGFCSSSSSNSNFSPGTNSSSSSPGATSSNSCSGKNSNFSLETSSIKLCPGANFEKLTEPNGNEEFPTLDVATLLSLNSGVDSDEDEAEENRRIKEQDSETEEDENDDNRSSSAESTSCSENSFEMSSTTSFTSTLNKADQVMSNSLLKEVNQKISDSILSKANQESSDSTVDKSDRRNSDSTSHEASQRNSDSAVNKDNQRSSDSTSREISQETSDLVESSRVTAPTSLKIQTNYSFPSRPAYSQSMDSFLMVKVITFNFISKIGYSFLKNNNVIFDKYSIRVSFQPLSPQAREQISQELDNLDTGLPELDFKSLEEKLSTAAKEHEESERRKLGDEVSFGLKVFLLLFLLRN